MQNYKRLIFKFILVVFSLGLVAPSLSHAVVGTHGDCLNSNMAFSDSIERLSFNEILAIQFDVKTSEPGHGNQHDKKDNHSDCLFCFHSVCGIFVHSRERSILDADYESDVVVHFSKNRQMISQTDPLQLFQPPKV